MKKKQVPSMVKDERLIEKRREQMTKAAVSLFKQKGFHRTTTREIAEEAGFSIGTLYEYIRKKEDILYLVCDSIYDTFTERLKKHIDIERGSIDMLKQAIAYYFTVINDLQDEMLVMYQEAKSLTRDALPYVLEKELQMTEIFEKILTRCVETGQLDLSQDAIKSTAHSILVLGEMWTFRRWALQKMYTLEEYTDLQIQFILGGVTQPVANDTQQP